MLCLFFLFSLILAGNSGGSTSCGVDYSSSGSLKCYPPCGSDLTNIDNDVNINDTTSDESSTDINVNAAPPQERCITINLDSLVEVTPNGDSYKETSNKAMNIQYSNQVWKQTYSSPNVNQYECQATCMVGNNQGTSSSTSTTSKSVTFTMTVTVAYQETTVINKQTNQQQKVKYQKVKCGMKVSSWPFQNEQTNRLSFTLNVTSNGKQKAKPYEQGQQSNLCYDDMGCMEMQQECTVQHKDGTTSTQQAEVQYEDAQNSQDTNQRYCTVYMPAYSQDDTMNYSPVDASTYAASMNAGGSSASSLTASSLLVLLVLLVHRLL